MLITFPFSRSELEEFIVELIGIIRVACIKYMHRTIHECVMDSQDMYILYCSYVEEQKALQEMERESRMRRWQ